MDLLLWRTPLGRRLWRYSLGSVVAFGVSELTFVLLFNPHVLGAKGSAIVASVVGIIPGYTLNRRWAWGQRGRSRLWREVVPYWVAAIASIIAAAYATGAVNDAVSTWSRDARTAINAIAYMAAYGVLFVAKFLFFNHWLWATNATTDASRA